MTKEKVTLFGGSGTMGFQAFKELWARKEKYDIILLVRPSQKNKKLFAEYEKSAKIKSIPKQGIVEGEGLKIVWGDATNYEDVYEACKDADYVLDAMAFISPAADYYPQTARNVNTEAIRHIIKAIESVPDGAERIRLVYTGTVAETGGRLQEICWGRVGDPLKPSIFDYYAVTKIAGEKAVLESNIKHWASFRMTYIMPTDWDDFVSLSDPIAYHMPLDACMENTTDRDAGFGMVNVLDIPDESDFWRRVYNFGGGPKMRITCYDYLNRTMKMNGMSGIEAVMERRWYALRNFHMQYYEDSGELNKYTHHWRDSVEDWEKTISEVKPQSMQKVGKMAKKSKFFRKIVEKAAGKRMRKEVENHHNGSRYWYLSGNEKRISAFFKDKETYEAIPAWGTDEQWVTVRPEVAKVNRLNHGYDELKGQLDISDLHGAAQYRGGKLISEAWNGDMFTTLDWQCCLNHSFQAKPNTILKAGHWCPVCVSPPWRFDEIAKKNPYFAQVWYPNHDKSEDNVYTMEDIKDIEGADKVWKEKYGDRGII